MKTDTEHLKLKWDGIIQSNQYKSYSPLTGLEEAARKSSEQLQGPQIPDWLALALLPLVTVWQAAKMELQNGKR